MKNNYLKAIVFIFINSIFFLQDTKPYELENQIKGEISFTHKLQNQKKELNLKQENFFNKNNINPLSIFLAFEKTKNFQEDKNEFLIESDEQFENQDSFVAKGNVIIKVKGATLKTDYIKFLKNDNLIISEGNIQYLNNNQFLTADKFTYNIIKKSGSISNVYGLIDVPTLAKDLNWELSNVSKKNF